MGLKVAEAASRATLWDWPTRLVHWLIVVLLPFSWWTATHDHLDWHRLSGLTILGLLLFRLIWGFAGASTARFGGFVAGPRRLRAYLAGRLGPYVGHNPLGGWSVLAMFAALAIQVGLGLFSIDEDSLEPGPLAGFLSFDDARAVAHIHHKVFWVILGLATLHIAAVGFYAVRGRNLLGPMLSGRGPIGPGVALPRLAPARRAVAAALVAAAVAVLVARGFRL